MNNKAIKNLGLDLLCDFCNHLAEPIISVGSGTGDTEKKISGKIGKSFICVDPKPESYQSGPIVIKPQYSTVDHLLEYKESLKENCSLFLNWPTPNESEFDIDAIMKLSPSQIVLVVATDGSAGGSKLLSNLKEMDWSWGSGTFYWHSVVEDDKDFLSKHYNIAAVHTCSVGTGFNAFHQRYILLQRKDLPEIENIEKLNGHKSVEKVGGEECTIF